jgi:hypothetical protein
VRDSANKLERARVGLYFWTFFLFVSFIAQGTFELNSTTSCWRSPRRRATGTQLGPGDLRVDAAVEELVDLGSLTSLVWTPLVFC